MWVGRTGSPWRDPPPPFGNWNTVFKRYRDWVKAGVFKRIFDAVSDDPDMAFAMVDATIVKVHRHAQGATAGPKIRPSASQRAAGPPQSSHLPTRLGIWCRSSRCPATASTP